MDILDDIDENVLTHSKEELLSIANIQFGVNLNNESPERRFFEYMMVEYGKLCKRCEELEATQEDEWISSSSAVRKEKLGPSQDDTGLAFSLPLVTPRRSILEPSNYLSWSTLPKNSIPSLPPDQPMIILHKVRCDQYHLRSYSSSSPVETIFFDVPQKLNGDILEGCLKGHAPVGDVDDFLKEHAHISIIVYRIYDCTKYCTALLKLAGNIGFRESRYKWGDRTLTRNGPVAVHISEEIYIANIGFHNNLLKALEELPSQTGVAIPLSQLINSPFPVLFHYGEYLRSRSEPSELHHPLLECLLSYVLEHYNDEYSEARDLFSKHEIKPRNLNLLISPGDILYTIENGHARGYVACGWPEKSKISNSWFIDCWFWAFNGKFWKARVSLLIGKFEPSDPETYPIAGLETFPIIYAQPAEVDYLRLRGTKFWEFHNRKYVRHCDTKSQTNGNDAVRNPETTMNS